MGHLNTNLDGTSRTLLAGHGIAPALKRELVSLPAWFPADKAAAILRHHATAFAFVTDRTGISGTASLVELERIPRTKSVAWVATPLGRAISLDTAPAEALAMMRRQGLDHLPASVGGLIVGIVTRDALEPLLAEPLIEAEALLSPLAA
jgi:CBS domain-containing protein